MLNKGLFCEGLILREQKNDQRIIQILSLQEYFSVECLEVNDKDSISYYMILIFTAYRSNGIDVKKWYAYFGIEGVLKYKFV